MSPSSLGRNSLSHAFRSAPQVAAERATTNQNKAAAMTSPSAASRFRGSFTALVTPFKDGKLDEKAFRDLVDWQIAEGTHGLVPVGTTGESPTLTHDEHRQVVEWCVKQAGGRVPVIAGAGSNNTVEAIDFARHAEKVGADAVLVVTPYYNKPTQEGLYQHYKAIAASVKLPIVVYSVAGRTGVNVEPSTLRRLSEIENIVGVKEASGNVAQMANICATLPESFDVLSGDDAITIALAGLGGKGIISVASNEIPAVMAGIAQHCLNGDFPAARALQRQWLALMEVNFVESNPIPVKAAMARMGLLEPVWRLPLVPPSDAAMARIEAVLSSTGLISN